MLHRANEFIKYISLVLVDESFKLAFRLSWNDPKIIRISKIQVDFGDDSSFVVSTTPLPSHVGQVLCDLSVAGARPHNLNTKVMMVGTKRIWRRTKMAKVWKGAASSESMIKVANERTSVSRDVTAIILVGWSGVENNVWFRENELD